MGFVCLFDGKTPPGHKIHGKIQREVPKAAAGDGAGDPKRRPASLLPAENRDFNPSVTSLPTKTQNPSDSLRPLLLIVARERSGVNKCRYRSRLRDRGHEQTFAPGEENNHALGNGSPGRDFIAKKIIYCNKSSVLPSRAGTALYSDGPGEGGADGLIWGGTHFQGAKAARIRAVLPSPAPLQFISLFLTHAGSPRSRMGWGDLLKCSLEKSPIISMFFPQWVQLRGRSRVGWTPWTQPTLWPQDFLWVTRCTCKAQDWPTGGFFFPPV